MGAETGIAWCDHTFNPWWGCSKVSPACTNCYAETLDERFKGNHWGVNAPRRFFSDKHWNEPLKWNALAEAAGVRAKVFCASMADVFEDRPDLVAHRNRLWALIANTPWLDWLLLTKRPENIERMLPPPMTPGGPPFFANVWLGTTVEHQDYTDRIDHLLGNSAVVHFVSCEPLLGRLDLSRWLKFQTEVDGVNLIMMPSLRWVITGSESGPGARPQNSGWYRELRDQCKAAGVAFFFKQGTYEAAQSPVIIGDGKFVSHGPGSWTKRDGTIEQPYLDGVQHIEFPKAMTFRQETYEHADEADR